MHIPSHMLQGAVCPVTSTVAAAGLLWAAWSAMRTLSPSSAWRFAGVSALIFALQMLNFPVQHGTSGHLLGGVLAVALLGLPLGVLSIALVVSIQALVFADGGLAVLGANILNMALIGAGVAGLAFEKWGRQRLGVARLAILGCCAWASVIGASFACALELAMAGTIPFAAVVPAMFQVHALIGVGEVALTLALFASLAPKSSNAMRGQLGMPLVGAVLAAVVVSPWASSSPDGLEWVAEKLGFLKEGAPAFTGLFTDYTVSFIAHPAFSTALAGLIGVVLTFGAAWVLASVLHGRVRQAS